MTGIYVRVSCSIMSDFMTPWTVAPPGSSVRGILQARILQWVVISFSRGSSPFRDQIWVSCIACRSFTIWAIRETWQASAQSLTGVWLFVTPQTAARQASLSIANSQSLLKLMSIELVMPSNHVILCPPLLFLPKVLPSVKVFSKESVLQITWPKYWSFSFSISPSNEYSGLISFRMDWFDLAVQGTFKSLLQHHSSKASILQHSAFFIVHLSHPYPTTGKTTALTRQTFVDKVISAF